MNLCFNGLIILFICFQIVFSTNCLNILKIYGDEKPVVSTFLTEDRMYLGSCHSDGTINFYHRHAYPESYPDCPYLYYGSYRPDYTGNRTLLQCSLNDTNVIQTYFDPLKNSIFVDLVIHFELVNFDHLNTHSKEFSELNNGDIMFLFNFYMPFSMEPYNDIWGPNTLSSIPKSLQLSYDKINYQLPPLFPCLPKEIPSCIFSEGTAVSFSRGRQLVTLTIGNDDFSLSLWPETCDNPLYLGNGLYITKKSNEIDSLKIFSCEEHYCHYCQTNHSSEIKGNPGISSFNAIKHYDGRYEGVLLITTSKQIYVLQHNRTIKLNGDIDIQNATFVTLSFDNDLLIIGDSNKDVHLFINYEYYNTIDDFDVESIQIFGFHQYYLLLQQFSNSSDFKRTKPKMLLDTFATGIVRPTANLYQERMAWHDPISPDLAFQKGYLLEFVIFACSLFIFLYSVLFKSFIGKKTKNHFLIPLNINQKWSSRLFLLFLLVKTLFSIYCIEMEPEYTNDLPSHLRFIKILQWSHTNDYGELQSYHGPCVYPGFFIFFYRFFAELFRYSLKGFQYLWMLMEILMNVSVFNLANQYFHLHAISWFLPLISGRLHLYNIQVVTNELPVQLLLILGIMNFVSWLSQPPHQTLRLLVSIVCFTLACNMKLNAYFITPAVIFIVVLRRLRFKDSNKVRRLASLVFILLQCAFIYLAITYLCYLPFKSNTLNYFKQSFELTRTFLWEKTRVWKFVKFQEYSKGLPEYLRFISIIMAFSNLWIFFQNTKNISPLSGLRMLLFFPFIFVSLAHGLFTPFCSWFMHTLPMLLACHNWPIDLTIILILFIETNFRHHGEQYFEDVKSSIYVTACFVSITLLLTIFNKYHLQRRRKMYIRLLKPNPILAIFGFLICFYSIIILTPITDIKTQPLFLLGIGFSFLSVLFGKPMKETEFFNQASVEDNDLDENVNERSNTPEIEMDDVKTPVIVDNED
eukprot:TRINITY_DN1055_c0_g1_i1.p1 TRINITY_DN1055_c0_g1~~TRINITY_DN1055_c0_g1_i1.p1  ORF type:complete len:983 (+),score=248.18 TRINITY_DN1055_c0_g1_i1:38-2950(+)